MSMVLYHLQPDCKHLHKQEYVFSQYTCIYTSFSEHFNSSFQMYGHIIAALEKVASVCSLYTFSNEIYTEN